MVARFVLADRHCYNKYFRVLIVEFLFYFDYQVHIALDRCLRSCWMKLPERSTVHNCFEMICWVNCDIVSIAVCSSSRNFFVQISQCVSPRWML